MAIDYKQRYPDQTDTDSNYPQGKARNKSAPSSTDGFPFEEDYINDQLGFFQKLLKEADISPTGRPDSATESQYYDGLLETIKGNVSNGTTGSLYLSYYTEPTDNTLTQAWDRLLLDVQTQGSSNYGKLDIVIDNNPNTEDGRWLHENPAKLLSGMNVTFLNLVEWVNTDTGKVFDRLRGMFEGIGVLGSTTTSVVQDIVEGQDFLVVANASGFSKDDFIDIKIQIDGANSGGYYPELYWVSQITNIEGNTLYLDVNIPWPVVFSSGTVSQNVITKIEDVARDITIINGKFLDTSPFVEYNDFQGQVQPPYVIGPLYFQYCHNIKIHNVSGSRMKNPLVQFREYNNVEVNGLRLLNPDAVGQGEGYGTQFSRGVFAVAKNFITVNERHVVDFTSSWYYEVDKAYSPRTRGTATFLLHGRFEAYGSWKDCIGEVLSFSAGFTFGSWSKENSFNNCHIKLVGGERTNSWYSDNCTYEDFSTRMYVDRFVAKNSKFGNLVLREETRLPSNGFETRLDSGVFLSNGCTFSSGELTGFERAYLTDTRARYGGSLQNKMLITDVKVFKAKGVSSQHTEFQHAGACGLIQYDSFDCDMDFESYTSWGVGAIRASGMSVAEGYDKVHFNFSKIHCKMNGETPSPIAIYRGGTEGQLIFTLSLNSFTSENCISSININEDATFYCQGNVYGNTFDTGGFRVNNDEDNGIPRNPIPSRVQVGINNYLNGATNYDNFSGGYTTEQTVALNFSGSSVPAEGELRSTINFDGNPLTSASDVFICSIKGLPVGLVSSVYYDQTTDNVWKIKVSNLTSSAVTLTSTTAIVTKFN